MGKRKQTTRLLGVPTADLSFAFIALQACFLTLPNGVDVKSVMTYLVVHSGSEWVLLTNPDPVGSGISNADRISIS